MLRKLKNNTASPVPIPDTGDTIPASGEFVIPPLDYGKYEGSADTLLFLSDQAISTTVSTLTANDGTFDLSIEKGVRMIQGGFCRTIVDADDPSIGAKVRADGTLVTDPIDLGDPTDIVGLTLGSLSEQNLASFTVGVGKTRIVGSIKVASFLPGFWYAYADADLIGFGLTGSGNYESTLIYLPRKRLTAGTAFSLKHTQRGGPLSDVHYYIGNCEI
jgi:hypothetical protein